MKYKKAYLFGVVFFVSTVTHLTVVRADAIPPPQITSLIQKGQDVEIVFEQSQSDSLGISLTIERRQQEESVEVVSMDALTTEDVYKERSVCGRTDYYPYVDLVALCAERGDLCQDCDGNGTEVCIGTSCDDCFVFHSDAANDGPIIDRFCDTFPEYKVECENIGTVDCCGYCYSYYSFEFWDRCVPVGETTYTVTLGDYDYSTINVTESGVPCNTDETDTTDSSEDTGSETGVLPEDTGSETGVLPEDSESETGVLPEDTGSETGVLPEDSESETGVLPEDSVSETVVLPEDSVAEVVALPEDSESETLDETGPESDATNKSGGDKGCSVSRLGAPSDFGRLLSNAIFLFSR